MKRFARFFSGGIVGTALLMVVIAVTPQPARAAADDFCDETENYTCCCSVDGNGEIISCMCLPKKKTAQMA